MKLIRCDRCGAENWPNNKVQTTRFTNAYYEFDLCIKCCEELVKDFLKGNIKEDGE